MKRNSKATSGKLLAGLTAAALLLMTAACAADEPQQAGKAPEAGADALKEVTLTWYYPGPVDRMKDYELVQEEMNKLIKPAINATLELKPLDWGAYEQKINTMNASGEKYDLVWTSPSTNNYHQNVAKDALYPLDDLLTHYAPKLKAAIPENVWNAAKVNGRIYGAINWQIVAMPYGVSVPKMYIDKYGIDMDAIASYEDFEPYLKAWKEPHFPVLYNKDGSDGFSGTPTLWGMDSIGGDTTVGWIRLDDPELTVFNQFETAEFKKEMERRRSLYLANYLPKDAAVQGRGDIDSAYKSGKYSLFNIAVPTKPGVAAEEKQRFNGIEVVYKSLVDPYITTNRAIATMTGISATSPNPERAMMLLELMNTNKELYRLMSYGIEGKHYKVTDKDKGVIEMISDGGYAPNTDWMYGSTFNGYYRSMDDVGNNEKILEMNLSAKTSPILGFSFNPEPVKLEVAQTTSVYKEYKDLLASGTSDLDKTLPEFLDKLNKAGAQKIIAEKQKQLDEWKKSNS